MSGEEMTAKEYSDYCLRLEGRKEELLHWLEYYDSVVSEIEKNDKKMQFTYPIFALLRELVSERLDKVEGYVEYLCLERDNRGKRNENRRGCPRPQMFPLRRTPSCIPYGCGLCRIPMS